MRIRPALQGFANPVPYFLVGVLTMGVAVVRSGLAERLARSILEHARGRSLAVYLHLVLAFPLMTFVLPSATTRSGILIHIYDEVFTLAAVPRGADIAKAVMLALSSINRLASTALLTGGITPVMSAAIIGGMSWTGWFALMAVPYYTILVLGARADLGALSPRPRPGAAGAGAAPRTPLTAVEWRTLAVILGASALWLTDAGAPPRSRAARVARVRRAAHPGHRAPRLGRPGARRGLGELLRDRRVHLAGARARRPAAPPPGSRGRWSVACRRSASVRSRSWSS